MPGLRPLLKNIVFVSCFSYWDISSLDQRSRNACRKLQHVLNVVSVLNGLAAARGPMRDASHASCHMRSCILHGRTGSGTWRAGTLMRNAHRSFQSMTRVVMCCVGLCGTASCGLRGRAHAVRRSARSGMCSVDTRTFGHMTPLAGRAHWLTTAVANVLPCQHSRLVGAPRGIFHGVRPLRIANLDSLFRLQGSC